MPHLVTEPDVSHVEPDEQQKPLLQSTELSPQTVSGPMEMLIALAAKANASGRRRLEVRIVKIRSGGAKMSFPVESIQMK